MDALNSLAHLLASFASAFSQEARLLRLRLPPGCGLAPDTLLPHRLSGSEHLSRCYRYDLECLSADAFLELKELLGLPIAVELLLADGECRTICGLVTRAEQRASDGGFARYGLVIEPALAVLAHAVGSRVFMDKSVPAIVQTVLAEQCAANPVIGAAFALDVQLDKDYPVRSYCLQYRESTQAFLERLLFEEGISYRFTFACEGDTSVHTLVLFDQAHRLGMDPETVRFHRADGTEAADSITRWEAARQVQSGKSSMASFDYKTASRLDGREDSAMAQGDTGDALAATLEHYDAQTPYYGSDDDELFRYAALRQQARDLETKSFRGESTVRSLQAGSGFILRGHPVHDQDWPEDRQFIVTSLSLVAMNNYPQQWRQALAAAGVPVSDSPYTNRFTALRRGIPLVPRYDGTLHARPTARGPQTATVVGPADEEIFTDELGRIKVQFHWQRPADHPDGGASFDERSSTWVRVVSPSAGAQWGMQHLPRIGQEVLIAFLEGDIDRPVCMGVLHNGTHPAPAFGNTGSLPANKALSGTKTKELHGHQYNELLFDDTTNEMRVTLSSGHAKTQLNQGYLIHPRTDGKGQPRGEGWELRTDAAGAIRAAKGLLISAEAQANAAGKQLDRQGLLQMLDAALALAEQLGEQAQHQQAHLPETGKHDRLTDADAIPGKPSAAGHQTHVNEALHNLERGTNTDRDGQSGSGRQPGEQAIVALSAPDGIAAATPASMTIAAGTNLDQVALRDTNQTSGRRWLHNAAESIALFVAGAQAKVKDTFKLIAAKGNMQLQAQDGQLEATAQHDIAITSIDGRAVIQAPKEILLAAGGGYIRIGRDIDIHNPGSQSQKAAAFALTGPTQMLMESPRLPKVPAAVDISKPLFSQQIDLSHLMHNDDQIGYASKRKPYRVHDRQGNLIATGITDEAGVTDRIFTNEPKEVVVMFDEGSWEVEEYVEVLENEEIDEAHNGEEAST